MKELEQLKKIYLNIRPSEQETEKSWAEFKGKINSHSRFSFPYFRYGVITLSLLVVFSAGLAGLTEAANPGSTLYPVKVLSDKVIAKVTGKPEIKIERRADDLIEVTKKSPEPAPKKVEEASKQYQKALDETEKEVKKDEKKEERINNSLNKQEEKLKEAIKENPKSEGKLEKALEKTQEAKEKLQNDNRGQNNQPDKEEQKQNKGKGK